MRDQRRSFRRAWPVLILIWWGMMTARHLLFKKSLRSLKVNIISKIRSKIREINRSIWPRKCRCRRDQRAIAQVVIISILKVIAAMVMFLDHQHHPSLRSQLPILEKEYLSSSVICAELVLILKWISKCNPTKSIIVTSTQKINPTAAQ